MTTSIDLFKFTAPALINAERTINDEQVYDELAQEIAEVINDNREDREVTISVEDFRVNGYAFSVDVSFSCYWCDDYITDQYGSRYDMGRFEFYDIEGIDVWFSGKALDEDFDEFDERYKLDLAILEKKIKAKV